MFFKPKEAESFSRYVTRLCGIVVGIGLIVLFQDAFPQLMPIGKQLIWYGLVSWLLFAALPYATQYTWGKRKQVKETVLKLFPRWTFLKPQMQQGTKLTMSDDGIVVPVGESKGIMGSNQPISTQSSATGLVSQTLPIPMNLLPENPQPHASALLNNERASEMIGNVLQMVGFSFEGSIEVLAIESGPTLQSITFKLPPKIQLSQLVKKRDDLANHLGHHQGFAISTSQEYVSAAVFIIPHVKRAYVYLRDLAHELLAASLNQELPLVFGKDMLGNPIVVNLAKLPHLLVAGSTGSGKSVCMNGMLMSLLPTRSPEQLKLLLIDPKMVEMAAYTGFPHMLMPPVTDVKRSAMALQKVVVEMEKRYERFAKAGVRNLVQYNKNSSEKLPYIVIFIDEYADLILSMGDLVEEPIQRITQMGRAAGIHLVLATQRPSVDVVTGVIKANLPSRVAFRLQSGHDFRTVMDTGGPQLLGGGDGICVINGGAQMRFQSAAVSGDDDESTACIENLKKFWIQQSDQSVQEEWLLNEEDEDEEQLEADCDEAIRLGSDQGEPIDEYERAIQLARENDGISVSILQHKLRCGYTHATEIIERMEQEKIVGPYVEGQGLRPFLKYRSSLTDEELSEKILRYICETKSTNSTELRDLFRIRKEKVLQIMSSLVEQGFLHAPLNSRSGYTIAWSEQEVENYLAESDQEEAIPSNY